MDADHLIGHSINGIKKWKVFTGKWREWGRTALPIFCWTLHTSQFCMRIRLDVCQSPPPTIHNCAKMWTLEERKGREGSPTSEEETLPFLHTHCFGLCPILHTAQCAHFPFLHTYHFAMLCTLPYYANCTLHTHCTLNTKHISVDFDNIYEYLKYKFTLSVQSNQLFIR